MNEEYLKKLDEANEELYKDYFDLCEKYHEKMPYYEFGFTLISIITKMLYDLAPSDETAKKTIEAAIETGIKSAKEHPYQKENNE